MICISEGRFPHQRVPYANEITIKSKVKHWPEYELNIYILKSQTILKELNHEFPSAQKSAVTMYQVFSI